MTALVSIGVAGALGPETIARIAPAVEAAGFHALWVNDTPDGDSLAGLAAAARATATLTLGTGVVPVDRRPVAEIVRAARHLPHDRLVLGIGSGSARTGALARAREAVAELREHTAAQVLLGALGPRMRALAARDADGPLLSWLTPAAARVQAADAHRERAQTHVALYVRTAMDPAATPRLEEEIRRYAALPNYAAHFARLGIDPVDTVLAPARFSADLRDYREAVDEVVLRAIVPGDDAADYAAFIDQAAGA